MASRITSAFTHTTSEVDSHRSESNIWAQFTVMNIGHLTDVGGTSALIRILFNLNYGT